MEKFLNLLVERENLREQFLLQTTPEGAYQVAKPYLDNMTIEEFKKSLAGLIDSIEIDDDSKEIIPDKDLTSVSGGTTLKYIVNNINDYISQELKENLRNNI